MAFGYYRAITIDNTKVPADLTNFPVGFIGTYSWLATVANGGRVQNANGYDIQPFSDTGLSAARTYELVAYNATTGEVELYWKEPTLHTGSADVDYIGHGDASISTDGSSTSTWDANFKAVYHFGTASSLSLNDSTSNARTLTNNNTATVTAGGVAGGAVSLNGTSQYLSITNGIVSGLPVTMTALFNPTAAAAHIVGITQASGGFGFLGTLTGNGPSGTKRIRANPGSAANSADTTADNSYTSAVWNYAGAFFGSTTSRAIRCNTVSNTNSNSQSPGTFTIATIGARVNNGTTDQYFGGSIDEVRISSTDRGANWFTAERNNLTSPSTFYSVGSEVSVGGGSTFTDSRTESLTASASESATADFIGARAETLTAAENETATMDAVVARAESLAASDSESATVDAAVATSESLTATATQAATFDATVADAETLSASESATAALTAVVARGESLTATDAQDATLIVGGTSATAESLAASDAATASAAFASAAVETLSPSDAAAASVVFAAALVESLAASDAPSATRATSVAITESLSASDVSTGVIAGNTTNQSRTFVAVDNTQTLATITDTATFVQVDDSHTYVTITSDF